MSTGALLPPFPDRTVRELGWVANVLGMRLFLEGLTGPDAGASAFDALAGLALRRNPRRAHLLVSRVLGKHLPVAPGSSLAAAAALAARVREVLPGDPASPALVLGFAETATALGQAVAAQLMAYAPGSACVLSTRRPGSPTIVFEEEHSHAVGHRVLAPAAMLERRRPVVLVDDELSSGRTAVNTIRALHRRSPHPGYVVASLLDLRPGDARVEFAALAAEIGVPVRAVSLLSGALDVPVDAAARVAAVVAGADPALQPEPRWLAMSMSAGWPANLRICARFGWEVADERALEAAVTSLAERLVADVLPASARRILVLGTEELMYAPLRLAAALESVLGAGGQVRYQSTTRSPVAPIDRDGYAVRCALAFDAPDEPGRQSFVYNVRPGIADHILVVTDGGDTASMLDALRGCAPVTQVLLRDEVAPAGSPGPEAIR